jgi:hypothetical protein
VDYRVILDKNDDNAGINSVRDTGTIDSANSFPFVSEYSGGLFYLRTEPIDPSKYAKVSVYDLWHRRSGHKCICKTIPNSVGLDELQCNTVALI